MAALGSNSGVPVNDLLTINDTSLSLILATLTSFGNCESISHFDLNLSEMSLKTQKIVQITVSA